MSALKTPLHHTSMDCITLKAQHGAVINDCFVEAIRLSLELNARVVVVHNDRRYGINPTKILMSVQELKDTE